MTGNALRQCLSSMGIEIEVCVQDYSAEASGEQADLGSSPTSEPSSISEEQWQEWFQRWLELLNPGLSPIEAYELSLRLTSDREIHELNAQYRQQDKPTDVLAFAALEADLPQNDEMQASAPLYLGDIMISVDTAQRQANAQGHSLEVELAWLAAHGLLHLLGWDHLDDQQLIEMLDQQKALLSTVGLFTSDS